MLRTEYIRPVQEILAGHAAARPDRIAFVDDVRAVTYSELAGTTARLAGHLQALGVERGDRVLLYLDNRVEVAESYLAIPRSGAVAVCVNPASPVAEVAHVLADSGARAVVTDAAHLDVVRGLAAEANLLAVVVVVGEQDRAADAAAPGPGAEVRGAAQPGGSGSGQAARGWAVPPEIGYASLLAAPAAQDPRDCLGLDDTAWMLYTSGTTGRPKGVYLTQRGCLWVVAACWAPVGIGPDDVLLSPLPLFHSYALVLCVLGVAAVGASERILTRFSVDDVAHRFSGGPEGDVTVFPGVPTMFHYLLDRLDTLDAPGLRMCISAGAILPAAVNERFERAFAVPLLDGYGITETSTMVTMNWPTGRG